MLNGWCGLHKIVVVAAKCRARTRRNERICRDEWNILFTIEQRLVEIE